MKEYRGIPIWDIEEAKKLEDKAIFPFQDFLPIAIPPNTRYALIKNGSEYYGILVTNNGSNGFRKDEEERIFIRTCPTFVGSMICKTEKCIEARV